MEPLSLSIHNRLKITQGQTVQAAVPETVRMGGA